MTRLLRPSFDLLVLAGARFRRNYKVDEQKMQQIFERQGPRL